MTPRCFTMAAGWPTYVLEFPGYQRQEVRDEGGWWKRLSMMRQAKYVQDFEPLLVTELRLALHALLKATESIFMGGHPTLGEQMAINYAQDDARKILGIWEAPA